MEERDYRLTPAQRERIHRLLFGQKRLPPLHVQIERTGYTDGLKLYFCGGGWTICRFSGTEPLLRIFCEMSSVRDARTVLDEIEAFLALAPR